MGWVFPYELYYKTVDISKFELKKHISKYISLNIKKKKNTTILLIKTLVVINFLFGFFGTSGKHMK